MIVLPIAGSHGGVVISQKAADMHIASATTRTGYVARGIAGKEAASCVHSHQTAASDILFVELRERFGSSLDYIVLGVSASQREQELQDQLQMLRKELKEMQRRILVMLEMLGESA